MISYMKINRTDDTPEVVLDARNGTILITGISFPIKADEFYDPIYGWVQEYMSNPQPETLIVFKMEYFNTASSKRLLEILIQFEKLLETGKDVCVKWLYPEDDDDIRSSGLKIAGIVNLTFELEKY